MSHRLRITGTSGICRSRHDECPLRANQLLMLFVQIVAPSGCWSVNRARTCRLNCSFFFEEVPYGKSMRHQRHVKIRGQTVATWCPHSSHQNPQMMPFCRPSAKGAQRRLEGRAWKQCHCTAVLKKKKAQKWTIFFSPGAFCQMVRRILKCTSGCVFGTRRVSYSEQGPHHPKSSLARLFSNS